MENAGPVRPELLKKVYDEEIQTPEKFLEILNVFYQRMAADTMIGFFFFGKDLKHIARQQMYFLLRAMGYEPPGPVKGPVSAHVDLPPIRLGFFNRRLVILEEVLSEFELSAWAKTTWIAFEKQFEKVVVH